MTSTSCVMNDTPNGGRSLQNQYNHITYHQPQLLHDTTVLVYFYIGSLVSFYDYLFIHCIVIRTYNYMHIAQYCANKQLN